MGYTRTISDTFGLIFMSIRKQFILLISALFIFGIIQTGLVYYKKIEALSQSNHFGEKTIPLLNKSHQLKLAVIQVQQWLTDISATRGLDGLNDGFDEAENNAQAFYQLIEELSQLDSKNTSHYQSMLTKFNDYYDVGKRMAKAYIEKGPEGGNKLMGEFDKVAQDISQEVNTFLENEMHIVKE